MKHRRRRFARARRHERNKERALPTLFGELRTIDMSQVLRLRRLMREYSTSDEVRSKEV